MSELCSVRTSDSEARQRAHRSCTAADKNHKSLPSVCSPNNESSALVLGVVHGLNGELRFLGRGEAHRAEPLGLARRLVLADHRVQHRACNTQDTLSESSSHFAEE